MGRLNIALVFFCLNFLASNAISEIHFSGYLKNYTIIQDEIDNDLFQFDQSYRMQNSGRFMLDVFNDDVVWQLHYEFGLDTSEQLQRSANSLLTPQRQSYRFSDLRPIIGPDDKRTIVLQNLDRFNVQFQFSAGDLTIGRQAITFGSARVINPTDVFLPFDVRTLDTEYRVGIDAIRFQKPMGQLGELDMGIVLGEDGTAENSAVFLQVLTNVSGSDYKFTAMHFSDQDMIGAGIQSALGELGFWFEAAYVAGDDDYTRASIGVDYAFNERIFGMLEYHFNGAGSNDTANYLLQQNDAAYRAGGVFLLARNYLIPTLSWQASTLFSLSAVALANLDDSSLFLSLNADYSLSDNLYLGLGYYHFAGDDISFSTQRPVGQQFQFDSEYGGNPDSLFASLRYYF